MNSKDRMAGKKFMQTAKEYEPYHDYQASLLKAFESCKESSSRTSSPFYNNGQLTGYNDVTYFEGQTQASINQCILGSLSPKDVRQMQIEGVVNYLESPETKKNLYNDIATSLAWSNDNYTKEMVNLAAQKLDIQKNTSLSQEQKDAAIKNIDATQ